MTPTIAVSAVQIFKASSTGYFAIAATVTAPATTNSAEGDHGGWPPYLLVHSDDPSPACSGQATSMNWKKASKRELDGGKPT